MTEQTQATPGLIGTAFSTDHLHISADTIDRITELAHASVSAQEVQGTVQLLVPNGYNRIDLTKEIEKAQDTPNRKTGNAHLLGIDSFLEYVKNQDAIDTGYIYADPEKCTLTAVFNDYSNANITDWRDHRATFTAELSRDFKKWSDNNKQQKEQEDFAIFLEDNIADIAEPAGDVLLAVALSLQAKTEVNFSSSKRLDNGQVQLTYTENVDARAGNGNIEIPREFYLGVRIFKNGDGYKLRARLKYRLHGGRVKFWYELDRVENAVENAFQDYIEKAKESGYTVLLGKP